MTIKTVSVTLALSERALRHLKFEAEAADRSLDDHLTAIVEDSAQFDLMEVPAGFRMFEGKLHLDGIPLAD